MDSHFLRSFYVCLKEYTCHNEPGPAKWLELEVQEWLSLEPTHLDTLGMCLHPRQ